MYSLQGAYPREDKKIKKRKENCEFPGTTRGGGKITSLAQTAKEGEGWPKGYSWELVFLTH